MAGCGYGSSGNDSDGDMITVRVMVVRRWQ